ncbi:hypothetical protein DFA_03675 [Cavenderia fasciculata]|uniref:Uncharacterized protein n=1 Tax=Cavenderia fasciculata TaxID=261658 RepID=F4Q1N8_CACFS|nr:uncharacterized protein DFA_03675 [Cavenderia fasciculata]EGG18188.1 hypothetical protein DFA_03675 [Cavenderia fasciculata]|eukprot:XP_004357011.1 hypothetical protein DFA_03675 [Cavenderia fasciculata]
MDTTTTTNLESNPNNNETIDQLLKEIHNEPQLDLKRKIDKLNQITGRRGSINKISSLLTPKTKEEAKFNASLLEQNEKLTRMFGERPEIVMKQ